MTNLRKALLAVFAFLTFGLFSFNPLPFVQQNNFSALADTIVRSGKSDECIRSVFIRIELFTTFGASENIMKQIAEKWRQEIEDSWNGPTEEAIRQAADDLGMSDEDVQNYARWNLNGYPDLQKRRQELIDKAKENLAAAGLDRTGCTVVNCCKIFFHAIIEVRSEDEEPQEGYDQIEIVEAGARSFVRYGGETLADNQKGTSGKWAFRPGRSPAAHEAGHLMGVDDEYHDEVGEDGKSHSHTHEGHEADLMAANNGWPKAEHITEILRIPGQPCDCCKNPTLTDGFLQDTNIAIQFSTDAITSDNCEYLTAALGALETKLADLQAARVPYLQKVETAQRLKGQIERVKEALKDCPKETATTTGPTTGISTGTDAVPTTPVSFDSQICETYGGGTVEVPNYPIYPLGPENPTFPLGPVKGPASVPGTTPQDTRPPEVTPGPEDSPTGTPTTPEGGNIKIGGGDIVVPFDPSDYDDNEDIIWGTDTGDGIDIGTPYDYDERDIVVPTPEEEDEEKKTTPVPTWLVFKVEQDVQDDQGNITKGPAEKTVMKLGYPAPDAKPGSDVQRTAQDTNNGATSDPRFVETDENGIGKIPIFTDGFESGDTSSWSNVNPEPETGETSSQGSPETEKVNAIGYTLDATPMKSRIVYLDASDDGISIQNSGDIVIENTGDITAGAPDDVDQNGISDWTEDPAKGGGGTPQTELPDSVKDLEIDRVRFGNTWGVTLGYKYHMDDDVKVDLGGYYHQENSYRQEKVNDPYFQAKGSWGQPYDDQWAIKSVGFTGEDGDAWQAAGEDLQPVIVAFIDTGLDWNHADISWDNVWVNEDEIPDNGIDDDFNGYVDDTIGWDFYTNTATPWDQDGHGTFTAGMVIARKDNATGIAGINPAAKVMILKALNDFGHTRASYLAKAIKYATDNGARIINLSIGGDDLTYLEELAVRYAHDRGVLIIVAAGNEAKEVTNYGLTPYEQVLAVASSDFEGARAFFSNHGPEIDIAAPGLDVLSLRARMTDFMRHQENIPYEAGSAYVGEDNRYFRSSGTSFSAPIVTGIASLILSKNPDLTNIQVKRMLLNSARDSDLPGIDRFSGYGVVDAVAALNADPEFEILADITAVEAVQDEAGAYFVRVSGTAGANEFDTAVIQIGAGEAPGQWKDVGSVETPTTGETLVLIPADEFRIAPTWTIRLVVRHKNGQTREQWYVLELG